MVIENFQVHSNRGTKLFCISWQPDGKPDAVLFIVHGLGEHSGRYEEMATACAENQIAVFVYDHRGHGQSEGKKGHARSIEQLITDLELALMKCRSLFLESPIFLYGHSMGGQIVASYVNKIKSREIKGAIISSAWFQLVKPIPSWQLSLVKKMATFLPGITLSNGINAKEISSVEAEVELYVQDPFVHARISLGLFHSLFQNGLLLLELAQPAKIPVLVCHGDLDKITSSKASEAFVKKLGENATFKSWSNAFHEPHHDIDKKQVIQFYIEWVKSKLE